NGQVILLNSAGIFIGEDAEIITGAFLVSDMEVTIGNNGGDGSFTLEDQSPFTLTDMDPTIGGITNLGSVNSRLESGIYVLAQFIDNQGDLFSSNGNVHLATATQIIVSASEDGLLGVELTEPLLTDISPNGDLIYNNGLIRSINGNVYLDLFYSDTIKANTVNSDGIIQATEIIVGTGEITIVANSIKTEIQAETELEAVLTASTPTDTAGADSGGDAGGSTATAGGDTEIGAPTTAAIDAILPECNESTEGASGCAKYNAVKRYLGRLLLGGSLPE
ncbi:MAG: hypothetical protein JKY24_06730, partial [Pseudomonadales bacterium]|nr:hypothetical protein [Pseudomonadales bacterium]